MTQGEAQAAIGGAAGNVTTSDTLVAGQLLLGNGTTDIVTEPDLVFENDMFGVGIANPISSVHFYENNSRTSSNAGVTIEQDGAGDVLVQFLLTGGLRWVMGVDNSDDDKFKIDDSVVLGGNAPLTITTGGSFGFGITNPDVDSKIDVKNTGADALRLRSGNASGDAINQVKMSLDGGLLHTHAIKTRHNAADTEGNAIDFYLWDFDSDATTDVGTLLVLNLNGDGMIGVNKTGPSATLDIESRFGETNHRHLALNNH